MKKVYKILFVSVMLLYATGVNAQHKMRGNVVVHADPRLLLLRKHHNEFSSGGQLTPHPREIAMNKPAGAAHVPMAAIIDDRPVSAASPVSRAATAHAANSLKTSVKKNIAGGKTIPLVKGRSVKKAAPVAGNKPAGKGIAGAHVPLPPVPVKRAHAAVWPPVHPRSGQSYSVRGFRVQIYNGPDRKKAIAIKTRFMRLYPRVHTYLTYDEPNFRVKVGDYSSRSDAADMLRQVKAMYSLIMIVPDYVSISDF